MSAVAPIKPDPAAPSKGPGTPAVRRIADLPGPKGWPVLGNLPQIKASEFHLQLERWAHEYGRYFQIRMANRHMLVVADHDAVATMLRDRPDGFRRSARLDVIGAEPVSYTHLTLPTNREV